MSDHGDNVQIFSGDARGAVVQRTFAIYKKEVPNILVFITNAIITEGMILGWILTLPRKRSRLSE